MQTLLLLQVVVLLLSWMSVMHVCACVCVGERGGEEGREGGGGGERESHVRDINILTSHQLPTPPKRRRW